MKKRVAHIALIILLMAPALSSMSAILSAQREEMHSSVPSPFAGDLEDQQDEADPIPDGETDQDSDILFERVAALPAHKCLKASPRGREGAFREHEREVGTPPPKRS